MSQVDTNPIDTLRIPPYSLEVEGSLFSAILLNDAAISLVEGLILARDFHHFVHKTIFQAIQSLIANGKSAAGITGYDWLQSKGEEKGSRGLTHLNALAQYAPNIA